MIDCAYGRRIDYAIAEYDCCYDVDDDGDCYDGVDLWLCEESTLTF